MQNLAGLGIGFFINLSSLVGGQEQQHTFRHGGAQPQTFQSSNNPIPAKDGTEPGHAGVGITHFRVTMNHHLNISGRPAHPIVKLFVGSLDSPVARRIGLQFLLCSGECRFPINRRVFTRLAADGQMKSQFFFGIQNRAKNHVRGRNSLRCRHTTQVTSPYLAV